MEKLTLKNGTVIVGNVTNETEEKITISITIPKSKIASIETKTVTENKTTAETKTAVETDIAETKSVALTKPEKKVPARPGNFEVTQGGAVTSPIDTKKLESAIKNSLLDHGYRILSEEPGVIKYMLFKNDWDLTMKFCYAADEYWYEYVSSRNLGAVPEKNKIHRNFPKWINILEQDIRRYYNA